MAVSNGVHKEGYITVLGLEDLDELNTYGGFTNSTSFTNEGTLTFTPGSSGDYLIMAFGNVDNSSIAYISTIELYHNNTSTSYGTCNMKMLETTDKRPWGTMVKLTLGASSQTFYVRMKVSDGTMTTTVADTSYIIALRLDEFANAYYAETLSQTTNTSDTVYNDTVTLTQTPSAGDHLVIGMSIAWNGSNTNGCHVQFDDGGVNVKELIFEPNATTGNDRTPFFWMHKGYYPASSHTWKIKHKKYRSGVGVANLASSAIAVLDLERDDHTVEVKGGAIKGGAVL